MKKLRFVLLLAAGAIFAEDEEPSRSLWDYHPLHLSSNTMHLGRASVDLKDGEDGGHLRFNKLNSSVYMLLPVSETTFFFPRVEWTTFEMDWENNPKFDEKRFYYLQYSLMMYSIALEKWRWITRLDYNVDAKHFSKGRYALWTWLLWGAYQIHEKWHYHIGGVGYVGMKDYDVIPVLGLDFSPNKKWTFQAIYPIAISAQYNFTDWCKLAAKFRPIRERFRAGADQPQPESIFHYSTAGAELNLGFEKFMRFEAEIFGGYNFGGNFYIKDKHGKNALDTNVKGSPYLGGSIDYAF